MGDHALLAARDIHGSLMQLHANLGGKQGHQHLEALNRHLRRPSCSFSVWKTIHVGTYRTPRYLIENLSDSKCNVDERTKLLIADRMFVIPLQRTVNLALVSVRDLGLELTPNPYNKGDAGVLYYDICVRALKLGLRLCDQEVGPYLRLNYKDQPLATQFSVASIPMSYDCGNLEIFHLSHFEDTEGHPFQTFRLSHKNGSPRAYYRRLDQQFVFEVV